jgi:hypothetical protein
MFVYILAAAVGNPSFSVIESIPAEFRTTSALEQLGCRSRGHVSKPSKCD